MYMFCISQGQEVGPNESEVNNIAILNTKILASLKNSKLGQLVYLASIL